MEDYTKMKNPELEALLKARGLPHAKLKKADMVARLQEDDAKKSKPKEAPAASKPAATASAEDEIDWDDDAADASKPEPASSATGKTTAAAGGQGRATKAAAAPKAGAGASKPTKADAQAPAPAADTTSAANGEAKTDKETAEAAEEKPKETPAVDFSSGIEKISLEDELEKRKQRAKKYGIQVDDDDATEAQKRLDRAKRFGGGTTEDGLPKALNEALPERRPKKRGRGENDVGGRGNYKMRGGGFRRGGFRGDRRGPPGGHGRRERADGGGEKNWMSDKDKAAAEARKARFAPPMKSAE